MTEENYLKEKVIAASLCKQYIESAKQWQIKMGESMECVPDNDSEFCERYIIYLSLRLIQSADHVWALHSLHPEASYIDSASIVRSMIEAAITAIFLSMDTKGEFIDSLIVHSFESHEKMLREITALDDWSERGGKADSKFAVNYVSKDLKFLENKFGKRKGRKWPDICSRSKKAGKEWEHLYQFHYRRLCQLSHLHVQNVFYSPAYSDKWPNNLEGSIAKGTEVALLALHTNYFFMMSIAKQHEAVWRLLNKFYSQNVERGNQVLKRSRFITPMEIEYKNG
jgi:hypothetical protein